MTPADNAAEVEQAILDALMAEAETDYGWLSNAQHALTGVYDGSEVGFYGEGSIDVAHAAEIAARAAIQALVNGGAE